MNKSEKEKVGEILRDYYFHQYNNYSKEIENKGIDKILSALEQEEKECRHEYVKSCGELGLPFCPTHPWCVMCGNKVVKMGDGTYELWEKVCPNDKYYVVSKPKPKLPEKLDIKERIFIDVEGRETINALIDYLQAREG